MEPSICSSINLDHSTAYSMGSCLLYTSIADHDHELTVDALTRLESNFAGRVRIVGPHDLSLIHI